MLGFASSPPSGFSSLSFPRTRAGEERMATVEQKPAGLQTNGSTGIPVENPATGEILATIPKRSKSEVKDIVARARAAQPAWEALGFEGRARIFTRAQKWI